MQKEEKRRAARKIQITPSLANNYLSALDCRGVVPSSSFTDVLCVSVCGSVCEGRSALASFSFFSLHFRVPPRVVSAIVWLVCGWRIVPERKPKGKTKISSRNSVAPPQRTATAGYFASVCGAGPYFLLFERKPSKTQNETKWWSFSSLFFLPQPPPLYFSRFPLGRHRLCERAAETRVRRTPTDRLLQLILTCSAFFFTEFSFVIRMFWGVFLGSTRLRVFFLYLGSPD